MTVEVLRGLARRRARGFTTLEDQWELALPRLASTGMGFEQVRKLAESCTGPTMASRLARVMKGDGRDGFATLVGHVDESPRNLTEWLGAIDVFYRWLERHGRSTRFGHALGYISCCCQTDPARALTEIVAEMLETYGYAGEEPEKSNA